MAGLTQARVNRLRALERGARREHRDDKVRGLLVRQQRTRVTYVVTTDVHHGGVRRSAIAEVSHNFLNTVEEFRAVANCYGLSMKIKATELPAARPQLEGLLHAVDMAEMQGAYLTVPEGTDFCPLLEGLENDHCQCPHWGYLIDGRIIVTYQDGSEEIVERGEFYYWPPGHTVRMEADTKQVEFSPKDQMNAVLDHVVSKME